MIFLFARWDMSIPWRRCVFPNKKPSNVQILPDTPATENSLESSPIRTYLFRDLKGAQSWCEEFLSFGEPKHQLFQ